MGLGIEQRKQKHQIPPFLKDMDGKCLSCISVHAHFSDMIDAMKTFVGRLHKKIAYLATTILLLVSGFGALNFGMMMSADAQMSHCPFMGMTSPVVCKMSPLEHVAAWQNMFTTTPAKDSAVLTFFLSISFLTLFFFVELQDASGLEFSLHRQRFRERYFIASPPLQFAFATGILNSKLF